MQTYIQAVAPFRGSGREAKMSRGRFTVRRLMVAVALVAVFFGGMIELPRLWILRRQYLGLAEKYGYWETRINGAVNIRQEITYYSIHQPRGPEPSPARLAQMKAEASRYAGLRAKYQRAAMLPWLSVAPDPPPP
jgi:hypothetical protein